LAGGFERILGHDLERPLAHMGFEAQWNGEPG
jgi:hypothetical protein